MNIRDELALAISKLLRQYQGLTLEQISMLLDLDYNITAEPDTIKDKIWGITAYQNVTVFEVGGKICYAIRQ